MAAIMHSYGVVKALERETMTEKENTTCTLVQLSQNKEEEKATIGKVGVITHLVKLLEGRGLRGKKATVIALYAPCLLLKKWGLCRKKDSTIVRYVLCSAAKENKVNVGVMRALVEYGVLGERRGGDGGREGGAGKKASLL